MRFRAEFDPGTRLRAIESRLRNPTTLAAAIGALAVRQVQRRFRAQGSPAGSWSERRVPNVAGILADLNAGRRPPARRFDSRPALYDRGDLAKSIAFRVVAPGMVEIGSALPYAGKHQAGGRGFVPVTEQTKAALAKWLDSLDREPGRLEAAAARKGKNPDAAKVSRAGGRASLARRALVSFLRPGITAYRPLVPARPFLVFGPTELREIEAEVRRALLRKGAP